MKWTTESHATIPLTNEAERLARFAEEVAEAEAAGFSHMKAKFLVMARAQQLTSK